MQSEYVVTTENKQDAIKLIESLDQMSNDVLVGFGAMKLKNDDRKIYLYAVLEDPSQQELDFVKHVIGHFAASDLTLNDLFDRQPYFAATGIKDLIVASLSAL